MELSLYNSTVRGVSQYLMYRIIEPIQIDAVYDLPEHKLTLSDLDHMIEFIYNTPLTDQNMLRFIKYNHQTLMSILHHIPTSFILRLYQDYSFLANYMSRSLYEYILRLNNQRLLLKLSTDQYWKEELIHLNNSLNDIYNFTDAYISKQLSLLRQQISFIDWSMYYLGADTLLAISQRQMVRIVKLYPITRYVNLHANDNATYYKDRDDRIICFYQDFIIIIDNYYYQNVAEILLKKDIIVLDPENNDIHCRLETYQQLDRPLSVETLVHTHSLEPLKYVTKGTFIKYRYQKSQPRNCYVCKAPYDSEVTYDRYIDMCLKCGQHNYIRRVKSANLSGCVAFVTGIRQKIGLQIALKLLRCGCKVIGTTRFPYATQYNFMKILGNDYERYKDSLVICQCDFLNLNRVNKLIKFLKGQSINILINSACQTIRPSEFYYDQLFNLERIIASHKPMNLIEDISRENQLVLYKGGNLSVNDLVALDTRITASNIVFNQFHDIRDIDIKERSSWRQNLQDIDPGEIMEATAINQVVPTLLINQLKPHMSKPRFIIQVAANEGTFNTTKTSCHAHTNMCKAAMNMLIRTLSEENEPDQYVYSINPSLVSGVNPQEDHYPLNDEDGAARILFPIIEFYNGTPINKDWIHIRNFKPENW